MPILPVRRDGAHRARAIPGMMRAAFRQRQSLSAPLMVDGMRPLSLYGRDPAGAARHWPAAGALSLPYGYDPLGEVS